MTIDATNLRAADLGIDGDDEPVLDGNIHRIESSPPVSQTQTNAVPQSSIYRNSTPNPLHPPYLTSLKTFPTNLPPGKPLRTLAVRVPAAEHHLP